MLTSHASLDTIQPTEMASQQSWEWISITNYGILQLIIDFNKSIIS